MKTKIESELKTVNHMIDIYCKGNHNTEQVCDECKELKVYVKERLEKCVYKKDKPICKNCPVHCYSEKEGIQIKVVMRYSGPRLIFKHPIETLRHMFRI